MRFERKASACAAMLRAVAGGGAGRPPLVLPRMPWRFRSPSFPAMGGGIDAARGGMPRLKGLM